MIIAKKIIVSAASVVFLSLYVLNGVAQSDKATSPSSPLVIVTFTNTVQASSENWTCGVEIKKGDTATLVASGEWNTGRPSDSGGNGTKAVASGQPALEGENEGCLIVRVGGPTGDFTRTFKSNKEPVYVQTHGQICFLANDYHHPKNGPGYADNSGELKVVIKIQTSHPENYPPAP